MADILLTVSNLATGEVLLNRAELRAPLTVGRDGGNDACGVVDAQGRRHSVSSGWGILSRKHLEVKYGSNGRLHLKDTSTNGVYVQGGGGLQKIGNGYALDLETGRSYQFQTGDIGFRVEVGSAAQPQPKPQAQSGSGPDIQTTLRAMYVSSDGRNKYIPLGGDALVALVGQGGEAGFETLPRHPMDQAVSAASARARDWALIVAVHGNEMHVRANPGAGVEVKVNRTPLGGDSRAVGHLDTVDLNGFLLRILDEEGPASLECSNPECRQLNPYRPEDNCSYCGTRLHGAQTRFVRRT